MDGHHRVHRNFVTDERFVNGEANHSHHSGLRADGLQVDGASGQRSGVQNVCRQHDHRPTDLQRGYLHGPGAAFKGTNWDTSNKTVYSTVIPVT